MIRLVFFWISMWCVLPLSAQSFDYTKIAPHPRLLWPVDGKDIIEQSMAKFPQLASVHRHIIEECTSMLSQRPVKRVVEGRRLLAVSRLSPCGRRDVGSVLFPGLEPIPLFRCW